MREELKETDTIYIVKTAAVDFGFDVSMKIACEEGVIAKYHVLANGTVRRVPLANVRQVTEELRRNFEHPGKGVVVKAHLVRDDGSEYEIIPSFRRRSG